VNLHLRADVLIAALSAEVADVTVEDVREAPR
jgi:hypothetical protein